MRTLRVAPEDDSPMHRRQFGDADSDDPAGDDVELLRARSSAGSPSAARPQPQRSSRLCAIVTVAIVSATLLARGLMQEYTDVGELKLVTWNIAAINNNPFEYWITHEDAAYNKLMVDVQEFISQPGERDVPVGQVFTAQMWGELKELMRARGWSGVDKVDELWTSDFSQRKIITGFMKDRALGEKRLASYARAPPRRHRPGRPPPPWPPATRVPPPPPPPRARASRVRTRVSLPGGPSLRAVGNLPAHSAFDLLVPHSTPRRLSARGGYHRACPAGQGRRTRPGARPRDAHAARAARATAPHAPPR